MSDTDRIIGELKEFKRWAEKEFRMIRSDLIVLQKFKWELMAKTSIASSIVTAIFMASIHVLMRKLE